MPAVGPQQTWRNSLLDHLVGAREERRRNLKPKSTRCSQIDGDPDDAWLLDRQRRRIGPAQDLAHVPRGLPPHVYVIQSVRQKGAGANPLCRSGASGCQISKWLPPLNAERWEPKALGFHWRYQCALFDATSVAPKR